MGLVVQTPAVSVPLFVVHAVVLLWIAWRVVRRQPLTAMFIIAYIGMYFPNPVALVMDWVPREGSTTDTILHRSNIMILVGIDLFVFAALRLRFARFDANKMGRWHLDGARLEMCKMMALSICGVTAVVLVVGLVAFGVNPFTVAKTFRSIGGAHSLLYLVAKYVFFLLPLVVFLVGIRRASIQMLYLPPVLTLFVVHFLIYRTRTLVVAAVIAWVVGQVAKRSFLSIGYGSAARRGTLVLRWAVVVAVPLLAVVGVSLRYARYVHSLQDYSLDEKRLTYIIGSTFAGGDLGYSVFLRRAMTLFPESESYLWGRSYYRLLFTPIPRRIWPGKPENTQRVFARVLDPALGDTGTTIPAGIVGDLYINFGYAGVAGMLVFGVFFGRERYRGLTDIIFLAGSGCWIFHLVRGGFTNPVVTMVMIWFLSYVFSRMIAATRGYPDAVAAPGAAS